MRRRLDLVLTRRSLSERSGVAESTIKRFETTGEVGTKALVMLLAAMGSADELESMFSALPPKTIDDVLKPARRRVQRADSGKKRSPAP